MNCYFSLGIKKDSKYNSAQLLTQKNQRERKGDRNCASSWKIVPEVNSVISLYFGGLTLAPYLCRHFELSHGY